MLLGDPPESSVFHISYDSLFHANIGKNHSEHEGEGQCFLETFSRAYEQTEGKTILPFLPLPDHPT